MKFIALKAFCRHWTDQLKRIINKKNATWILFLLAFADASLVPTPVTTVFIIMISLNRRRSIEYIAFGTAGILLGGITAYVIGRLLWLDNDYGYSELAQFVFRSIPGITISSYNAIQSLYIKWDLWLLFFVSFTPLPYGIFALTSGAFQINILLFILSAVVSNLIKFVLLAALTGRLEEKSGTHLEQIMQSKVNTK